MIESTDNSNVTRRVRYISKQFICFSCEQRKVFEDFSASNWLLLNMNYQGEYLECESHNRFHVKFDHSEVLMDENLKLTLEDTINKVGAYEDNMSIGSKSAISQEFETDILKRNLRILPSVNYESDSMESSSGSVDDINVKNDEVKTPPIPQFVKYSDKITNICKICYDDSIPAHVSCVTCNQKYHIQCLTRELYEKFPTCQTVWHRPDTIDNLGDIILLRKKLCSLNV